MCGREALFQTNIESVTKDMRRKAKEVNFGLIYGMESFGLSKSLNISKKEIDKFQDPNNWSNMGF